MWRRCRAQSFFLAIIIISHPTQSTNFLSPCVRKAIWGATTVGPREEQTATFFRCATTLLFLSTSGWEIISLSWACLPVDILQFVPCAPYLPVPLHYDWHGTRVIISRKSTSAENVTVANVTGSFRICFVLPREPSSRKKGHEMRRLVAVDIVRWLFLHDMCSLLHTKDARSSRRMRTSNVRFNIKCQE